MPRLETTGAGQQNQMDRAKAERERRQHGGQRQGDLSCRQRPARWHPLRQRACQVIKAEPQQQAERQQNGRRQPFPGRGLPDRVHPLLQWHPRDENSERAVGIHGVYAFHHKGREQPDRLAVVGVESLKADGRGASVDVHFSQIHRSPAVGPERLLHVRQYASVRLVGHIGPVNQVVATQQEGEFQGEVRPPAGLLLGINGT